MYKGGKDVVEHLLMSSKKITSTQNSKKRKSVKITAVSETNVLC